MSKLGPGRDDTQGKEEMIIEYVKDPGGARLKLQVVDGMYYPTFPVHVIRNMSSVKLRADDVILAGYLKSGTHWVFEMARMLLAGTTDVINVEKDQTMIEQTHQEVLESIPSPRILNTHVLFQKLPTEVLSCKPKIVYLTRNPKDIAVSMYHHHKQLWEYYAYEGTFDDYLHLFLDGKVDYGSWFDHIKNWSDAARERPEMEIFELNYEDLSENTVQHIRRLATFLGLTPTEEFLQQIQRECSLHVMRDKKGHFDLDPDGNPIMYRKGKVGDWRNVFTVSQNSHFERVYQAKVSEIHTHFHWRFQLDS